MAGRFSTEARRGASQDYVLDTGTKLIAGGQRAGSIRPGDPTLFTRAMLLVGQSYALFARTMTDDGGPLLAALDAALAHLLDR